MYCSTNIFLSKPKGSVAFAPQARGHHSALPINEHLKVLVVDDARDLADMTAELLRMHGIDVLVAYSGDEALRILRDGGEINAVFSDVMMPKMSGFQLAEAIGQSYPDTKVVLTSGYVFPKVGSQEVLNYPIVTKPYSIESVVNLLRTKPISQ